MSQPNEIRPRMLGAAAAGAAAVLPPIGALIAALNWRHFGKRDWMINSLLILFLYVVLVVLGFVLIFRQLNTTLSVVVLVAALLLFWTFYLTTQILQGGAYKHWTKYKTLDDYHYNFPKAIGYGVGIVVLAVVAIGVLVFFQSRPTTFTHTDLTISVPSDWEIRNLSEVPDCATPTEEYTCIGFFAEARFGFTQILISRQRPYDPNMTLDDHVEDWRYWVEDVQGGRVISVNGRTSPPEITVRVDAALPPDEDEPSPDNDYTENTFTLRNGYLYSILVWAENKGIFEEHRADVNAFFAAIEWI